MLKRLKDQSVFNMLQSEQIRCARVISNIDIELEKLPHGSIGHRKVKRNGKEYIYTCHKFREGTQVKCVHISANQIDEIRAGLERRNRLLKDRKANKRRMDTIAMIIKKG